MGMSGKLQQLSPAALDAIRADAQLLDVLYPSAKLDQLQDIHKMLGTEDAFRLTRERRPAEFDELPTSLDMDKTWHAIHYLLTGQASGGERPLADAVLGGTEIGSDKGYGPARYLHPDEAAAVARVLDPLGGAQLLERWNPERLVEAEIYPSVWSEEDAEWIVSRFTDLRAYYLDAEQRGSAMLLQIV
jgi:hypothetical protein